MDAGELLRGDAPFVADTSAWWRAASLPSELGGLVERALLDDRLWLTPIVRASSSEVRMVERARIVLAAGEGVKGKELSLIHI